MKRAIPAIVVLAVVAAAVAFFVTRKSGALLDLAPGRGAELAPGDALFYMELPDVARSGKRWKETALYAISQEPEWKDFTAKWNDFKAQNEVARLAFGVVADIEKADPAGLFLAVSTIDGPFPKAVGGFPYRGKKSDVEGVIRQLREQLLKAYPAAKSDIAKIEDTEVETLTDKDFLAAMAFRDNWFFFGTDMGLMQQTLARYANKPDAPAGLAKDALFQATLKNGVTEPDAVAWVRWEPILEKMQSLTRTLGGPAPPVWNDPNPVQAFLYTGKMDGGLMREQIYMQTKVGPKRADFANRSLGFTQPATYAYLVVDHSGLEEQMKAGLVALDGLGASAALNKELAPKGLKVEDILTTFGPELAMMSAWEGGAIVPDFFAAVEVRDAVKARLFAELIAAQMGTKVAKSELEGTTFWEAKDLEIGPIQPTLAVNEKHLMFGLNSGVVRTALAQLKTKAPNLASRPDPSYPSALKTVLQPTGGLIFVDAKTLFERLYEKAKPFIAFQLIGEPEVAKHFDAGKLPKAETISKHLSPIVLSVGATEHGWKVESTGTISFMGAYGLVIPAGFLSAGMAVRQAPPPTNPPPPNAPVPGAPASPPPAGANPGEAR